MRKCNACKFVRYCSEACQRTDWRLHKNECSHLLNDVDFTQAQLKAGNSMFYGRISGYDFQVIRQLARNSDGVKLYDNKDFSLAHRIGVVA